MPSPLQPLEEMGILPTTPAIRSSDENTCRSDPFCYLLARRLGLIPALSRSPALAQGAAFHHVCQAYFTGEDLARFESEVLAETLSGCDAFEVSGDERQRHIAYVKDDYDTASAWFHGASRVTLPTYGTFTEFIHRDQWQIIAAEECFHHHYKAPSGPLQHLTLTAQPDLLLYHRTRHTLWPVDYKTCSEPTNIRAATLPIEFQSVHYPFVLSANVGMLADRIGEPVERVEGMIHILVQKPSIRMGNEDRPYTYHSEGKRSGVTGTAMPDRHGNWSVKTNTITQFTSEEEARDFLHKETGKTPSKIYQEDPDPALFRQRIVNWYLAEAEQLHRKAQYGIAPPVDISFTTGILDDETLFQYHQTINDIIHYATCNPDPKLFPKNAKAVRSYGRLSAYAPFYLSPVHEWPNIIEQGRFVVRHRDEALPPLHQGSV